MRFADFTAVGPFHSITADIEGHEGEYVVAAKLGFAIFNKSTGDLRYIKKVYDDPTTAERFGPKPATLEARLFCRTRQGRCCFMNDD